MSSLLTWMKDWLQSRSLKPNTQRLYELEVTRFDAWFSRQRRPVSTLTAHDIQNYLTTLQREPEDVSDSFHVRRRKALNPRSREQARRILHAFFEWSVRQHHIHFSPFWEAPDSDADLRPQLPPPIVVPQLSKAMKNLLKKTSGDAENLSALRAAIIAHLAFWLGASRSEIAALTIDDYIERKKGASLRIRRRNGDFVERSVPRATRRLIRSYLMLRSRRFPNLEEPISLVGSLRNGGSVSDTAITQALAKWQDEEDSADSVESLNPRRLRQSFESIACRLAVQERVVAKHFRTDKLRSAIDRGVVPYHPGTLYASVAKEIAT